MTTEIIWKAPGKIIQGTHYILSGPEDSQRLIVLIHGNSFYSFYYNSLTEKLAAHGFRVLVYDLLGRGFSSPNPSGQYDASSHIDQLRQLLVHLNIVSRPYDILAHSMGGGLGALYAAKYPSEINSLTLIAPAGLMKIPLMPVIRNVRLLRYLIRNAKQKSQEADWRGDFYDSTTPGENLDKLNSLVASNWLQYKNNPNAFHAFWRTIVEFPMTGASEEVKILSETADLPIFIIWGKEDKGVPFSCLQSWTDILQNGKCKLTTRPVEKAGHGVLIEHADTITPEILAFLDDARRKTV